MIPGVDPGPLGKSIYPGTVLRIRDALVRIWIRGSVPLTNDPYPDPAIFVSDIQDGKKKKKSFFKFYFLKVNLHHF